MTSNIVDQDSIRAALGVAAEFDVQMEAERRIAFLTDYLAASERQAMYSASVAASTRPLRVGWRASRASERTPHSQRCGCRTASRPTTAKPCRRSTSSTRRTLTVDIKPAVDALHEATTAHDVPPERSDFVKGNIKARQRMVAQYAVAGRLGALVVGTDQAAEAVMGFFTKFGDGAFDIGPLLGLTKARVRALGEHLGAPKHLVMKMPTADLEDRRPALPDEVAYGVTYQEIDAYLVGEDVGAKAREVIETAYRQTAHKRQLPPGP